GHESHARTPEPYHPPAHHARVEWRPRAAALVDATRSRVRRTATRAPPGRIAAAADTRPRDKSSVPGPRERRISYPRVGLERRGIAGALPAMLQACCKLVPPEMPREAAWGGRRAGCWATPSRE